MKPSPLQTSLAISLLAHGLVFGVAYAVRQAVVRTPPRLANAEIGVLEIIAAPGNDAAEQPALVKAPVADSTPAPTPPAAKPVAAAPTEIPPTPKPQPKPTTTTTESLDLAAFLDALGIPADAATTTVANDEAESSTASVAPATSSGEQVIARCLNNPKPPYPRAARQQRQEGMVLLTLTVSADGSVAEVQVKQSSNYRLLDEAAFSTVKQWRFAPARIGNVAVSAQVEVPVRFKLSS
jgi:protein TonB